MISDQAVKRIYKSILGKKYEESSAQELENELNSVIILEGAVTNKVLDLSELEMWVTLLKDGMGGASISFSYTYGRYDNDNENPLKLLENAVFKGISDEEKLEMYDDIISSFTGDNYYMSPISFKKVIENQEGTNKERLLTIRIREA